MKGPAQSINLTNSLLRTRLRSGLSRSKDHHEDKLLGNIEEPVLATGFDKNYRALADRLFSGTDPDLPPTQRHVVDLIFAVRCLVVRGPWRKNIKSGTHGGHAKKFPIRLSHGLHQALKLKYLVHPNAPWKKISVYCWVRLSCSSVPSGRYH